MFKWNSKQRSRNAELEVLVYTKILDYESQIFTDPSSLLKLVGSIRK